ncbi:MAG: single-stranded-DNA-specific exonuclease RecJ [Ruminococcaceae bacterium]|nr:single-stranded-DNA-specific exonuclease RecJ [Oscillospiraceae bacterium]
MLNRKFRVKETNIDLNAAAELSSKCGISMALAKLLVSRNIDSEDKYKSFCLNGAEIMDPHELWDMEKAAKRVYDGVKNKEKILIFGDYDADGVTSVTVLYLYLKELGADVGYYIPSRLTEGYGMNEGAIEEASKNGVKLIITVDTGITAVSEIAYAAELGIDVVVTDHHEPQEELPKAVALVDPKRQPISDKICEYAGVGVAMKLASAVEGLVIGSRQLATVSIFDRFSDIVAIGTVADIMSLTGENRQIVKRGLEKINSSKCRPGITALLESSLKKGAVKNVTAKSIGFTIAPRINAAGRMGNAETALKLLICEDPYECEALASELCLLNTKRQNEENSIIEEIVSGEGLCGFEKDRVIVLGKEGWHHGVIGIVCSKIVEHYKKPVILLAYEDNVAKGSCRSVEGFNIVRAIECCSEYVERFGGHDLAAGVTLKVENVDSFRRAINEYAEHVPEGDGEAGEEADMALAPAEITLPFALELKTLEPFGKDNPEPLFVLEKCKIVSTTALSMGRHTKITVSTQGGICFEGLMFSRNAARLGLDEAGNVSLLFTIEVNEYMKKRSLSLNIKEICFEGDYGKWLETNSHREYERFRQGSEIGKMTVNKPEREKFVRLYTLLRVKAGYEGDNISYRSLGNALGGANYFEVRTMLDVFSEAGLLEMSYADGYGAFVKLNRTKAKADIEATPTYIRLKELS